jgi:hypothetical protein
MTVFREQKTKEIEIVLVERPLLPGDIPSRRGADQIGSQGRQRNLIPFKSVWLVFEP